MALSPAQITLATSIINYYSEGAHPEADEASLKFFPTDFIVACLEAAVADDKLLPAYRAQCEAIIEDLGDVTPVLAEESEPLELKFCDDGEMDPEWDEFEEDDDLGDFVCGREYEHRV